MHYDELDTDDQAQVRDAWERDIDDAARGLDLTTEFAAEGRTWVELGSDGQVTERSSGAT